jgi:type IV pilus assembly protein PilX
MDMLNKPQTPLPPGMFLVNKPYFAAQQGVVLIVALIMLAIISLMAASTIKGSGSSEALSSSSRTQSLALQAADAALRYCEEGVQNHLNTTRAAEPERAGSLYIAIDITPEPFVANTALNWINLPTWDVGPRSALIYTLPATFLNNNNIIYRRMPECMAQVTQISAGVIQQVVITARGFGPEAANVLDADVARKPRGSEVWLQSYLNFE